MTPERAQRLHNSRQALDADHDRGTCWCCCDDCDFDTGKIWSDEISADPVESARLREALRQAEAGETTLWAYDDEDDG